jgi:signal transduction histidine kinase
MSSELDRAAARPQDELQAARQEIHALSYAIAHNLRSPLRAIAAGAQIILEDKKRLGEEACQWAGRIIQAANRMDELVLGLLEYSRLAWQDLSPTEVSLQSVVREVLRQLDGTISDARADVAVDVPLPSVNGCSPALEQALAQILSNALKFVGPDVVPKIRIRAERRDPRFVRLVVEDNGIGIAPEHQARIFGMFEQIHPRESYLGTGIGLAITRRIVERMGGKVGVESEVGRGSRFYLELPEA